MSLTHTEKIERIKSLNDEVNELHPLLRALLPLLPNVLQIEYTHGNEEMGADLVLEAKDPVLGKPKLIGVIAKTGKIRQGDLLPIDRQIEECKVERLYLNGKKKIYLDQIWVVTTDNITGQAKRLIHEKHRATNVDFVTGEDLVTYVDKHFQSYWSEIGSEVASYLRRLSRDIGELETKLSLLKDFSHDIYIEPDVYFANDDYYNRGASNSKPDKPVDIYEISKEHELILLEGEPGVGKSKFLRNMAQRLCDAERFKEHLLIPVFFSFKEFCEDYEGSVDTLIHAKVGDSLEPLSAIKGARFILIADSLDESKTSSEDHVTVLDEYFGQVSEKEKIVTVASSRQMDKFNIPEGYFNEVQNLELRPLSPQKIFKFLKEITKQHSIPERLLEDAKKSALFKDLPRCPIAAILLGQILTQESKELPSTLPELYSQYVEISVGRWENLKGLQSQKEFKALDAILQNIAVFMMKSGVDRLNKEEAKSFYTDYFSNRNLGIYPDEFFERSTNRCSIICLVEGNSLFCFKHRSFVEFYYAKKMKNTGELTIDNDAFHPYWSHSFYFYIGLLEEPDKKLTEVINLKPSSDIERYAKYVNLSDYLLSGYTSKYEIIENGVKTATREAAKLYLDTVENPTKREFSNFPQLYLLWLVQYTYKMSYSYEFLKKSFEKVSLELIDEIEDEQELAVCLFLLDVTDQLHSKDSEFKFLAEYKGTIPTMLSVGIGCEMKSGKKSKSIKKIDKNFRARLKADKKLYHAIEQAGKRSIRDFVFK